MLDNKQYTIEIKSHMNVYGLLNDYLAPKREIAK